jgi:hypothetical protein
MIVGQLNRRSHFPFLPRISNTLELLAKLLKNKEVVIPGKRSATRNPGFSSSSGFRLSPE